MKPNRPSVIAVGPKPPPVNGMSKAFEILIEGIPNHGWDVHLIDTADRSGRRGSSFSLRRTVEIGSVVARATLSLHRGDLLYICIAQSLLGFLKDAAMLAAAQALRMPAVVHLHGGNFRGFYSNQNRQMQALIRRVLSPVSQIIVEGKGMRPDFSMVDDWDAKTISIENPCDLPLAASHKPKPLANLRLLYLSNLLVQKGYLDVLEASAQLRKLVPSTVPIHLDFAGAFQLGNDSFSSREEMRADFESKVKQLPSGVTVQWHGVVDGATKQRLLQAASVFVLPTYYVNEGQPVSLIEAMTVGLPIIATGHRNIPEMLPDSFKELRVEAKSPAQIAEKVALLWSDSRLYEELSRDALHHAQRYRPDVHLRRMAAVFDDVLGLRRTSKAA